MNELRDLDVADVLALATAALSRASGERCVLEEPEILSDGERRNLIIRARAARGDCYRQSVLIKATRAATYDPTAEAAFEHYGLIREWAATAYIAQRAPGRGHGAPFLASDLDHGILIYEDLGTALGSLVDALLGDSASEAERALMSYAAALGRLHADTAGCTDAHAQIVRSALGSGGPMPAQPRRLAQVAAGVQAKLGGHLPDDELAQVSARVATPGAWLALVHGDPCPDNAVMANRNVRLIDFEFARPGHCLFDALYWRMGFPTCWCAGRVPPDIAVRVENVYRAEVGRVIAAAVDDRAYAVECAHVATAWLFSMLAWRLDEALRDDTRWGITSVRSRLPWYLETVSTQAAAANTLPGVRSLAQPWRVALRRSWSELTPLDVFPAFVSGRGQSP